MNELNQLPQIPKKPEHHRLLISAFVALVMIIILTSAGLFMNYENNKKRVENRLKDLAYNFSQNQNQALDEIPKRDGEIILKLDDSEIKTGDTFEVKILLNTKDTNIVLASAKINFNQDELELIGKPDTNNSVLGMNITENVKNGEIEITRGATGNADYSDDGSDNGYTGENGLLAILKFKALASGTTKISFVLSDPGLIYGTTDIPTSYVDKKISTISSLILDDGRGTLMKTDFQDLVVEIK
jgi:hypothetical protein